MMLIMMLTMAMMMMLYTDYQLVRGSHHGQLRLPDARLVHPWTTSPRRVCTTVVRVRPRSQVRLFCIVVVVVVVSTCVKRTISKISQ